MIFRCLDVTTCRKYAQDRQTIVRRKREVWPKLNGRHDQSPRRKNDFGVARKINDSIGGRSDAATWIRRIIYVSGTHTFWSRLGNAVVVIFHGYIGVFSRGLNTRSANLRRTNRSNGRDLKTLAGRGLLPLRGVGRFYLWIGNGSRREKEGVCERELPSRILFHRPSVRPGEREEGDWGETYSVP